MSLLLYDLSSFCFFFLTCSSFFFFFLTRTWTSTYWHSESLIQLDTDSPDTNFHWITIHITDGALSHFWGTNDSDARARARAVGVLTLHRADFQRVLARRAIPPARPHFGKRLVDYVCVCFYCFYCFYCFSAFDVLLYLLTIRSALTRSYSVLRMYYTLMKTHPHPRRRLRRPRRRHADITAKTRRRGS